MKGIYFGMLLMAGLLSVCAQAQPDSLLQRILLVGDAGEMKNGRHPELELLKSLYDRNDPRTAILYLGDNIYPLGLPAPTARNYEEKKHILDDQVSVVQNTLTQAWFIPGNHDWKQGKPGGWDQLQHQQQYFQSLNLPNVHFAPLGGCPGPVEIPLNDQVVIVMIDSQWWLHRHEKPGITSGCECKTDDELVAAIREILYRHRSKLVIFAAHHPFKSYGEHGGYFTWKQHIFPLTSINPALYIPLPLIGSLYPLGRSILGNIQDLHNPRYKSFIRNIDTVLSTHPYCIRVAGHEHTLQLIEENRQEYVVSGGGSKGTAVKKRKNALYAREGPGFGVLEILKDGRIWLKFFSSAATDSRDPVYTAVLKPYTPPSVLQDVTITPVLPDSVTLPAAPYFKANGYKKFFFGSNYRKEWTTPVRARVLDIGKDLGGLKPGRLGGGLQSRSLRLEDARGREYVLRSIEKFPDKTLPEEFRETFVMDAVADGISASYPYGALSVPTLAVAAGVPHANPRLVYVPDDPRLGPYRSDFANRLFLFEEREPGGLDKTYNTDKVLLNLADDNDDRIDQRAVLQARLLDMFIMDFDRHDDQWRWGAMDNGKGKTYFPIPRDRDQAFFINTGLIPHFLRSPWYFPKFQGFRPHAININTFNTNARFFDRSFLTALSKEDWTKAVDSFVPLMTDAAIEAALQLQPAEVRNEGAPWIVETLKKRRRFMKEEMLQYYRFLAREVDVTGSDKNEWFDIARNDDGSVQVQVFKLGKEGNKGALLYSRTFVPSETREIRLWGMGGNDRFDIHGNASRTIRTRIIGGAGEDIYNNTDTRTAAGRTKIYDLSTEKNTFTGEGRWRSQLSARPEVNYYNRKAFQYNILAPFLSANFNADDGIYLGVSLRHITHGFRKEPYKTLQHITVNHSLDTKAFRFNYLLNAVDVIGKADLVVNATVLGPNNTRNFFGLGNETIYDRSDFKNISYYRTRYNFQEGAVYLKFNPNARWSLLAGPAFQHFSMNRNDNKGRFIEQPLLNGLDSSTVYRSKAWLGGEVSAIADTRNNKLLPSTGVYWINRFRLSNGLNSQSSRFGQLNTDISVYFNLGAPGDVVIGLRAGGGINIGHYEFFQAQYLNGLDNLRGFRKYRFAGDKMLFQNIDLRLRIAEFRGYLFPGTFGLLAFHDIGRVWVKGESSRTWHTGAGGGIWLSPARRYVMTANVGYSNDGWLPFASLGFQF